LPGDFVLYSRRIAFPCGGSAFAAGMAGLPPPVRLPGREEEIKSSTVIRRPSAVRPFSRSATGQGAVEEKT